MAAPLSRTLAARVAVATTSPAAAAEPAKARFLQQSLASEIVQQMAQRRIFEADDRADRSCRDKELVEAFVIQEPFSEGEGAKQVRKWHEDWVMRRCDRKVM